MVANVVQFEAQLGKRDPIERNSFFHISEEQLKFIIECAQRELAQRAKVKRDLEDRETSRQKLRERDATPIVLPAQVGREARFPRSLRPEVFKHGPRDLTKYITPLLAQDWSHLWPNDDERKRYCVYAHVDPNSKGINGPHCIGGSIREPFYIGKGTLDRAYNLERNQGHGIKLRQLLALGIERTEIVKVLRAGLTEREAFEMEAKLIYFFGTIYEKKRRGILLNLDLPALPDFRGVMKQIHFYKKKEAAA